MIPLPPLHPMMIHFPAALLPASLGSDVLGKVMKRPSLRHAAWWMLAFGAASVPLAVLTGWVWLRAREASDGDGLGIHKWLGTSLALVFVPLVVWRWRTHAREGTPGWPYLAAAAVAVGLMIYQAHIGGMMSFGEG